MVRISKQPDERRAELLETADKLFSERGFASVKVSDIVSAMGVAQGTFYYYFQTKDEIMVALLEQKWLEIAAVIDEKASGETDAIKRLTIVLTCMVNPGDDIKHDPGNRLLADSAVTGAFHPDFDRARVKSLFPVMLGVVEYGIMQGVFPKFLYTTEVVKILFLGISAYFHQVETKDLPAAVSAVCETIERVLGLPAGTLKIDIL